MQRSQISAAAWMCLFSLLTIAGISGCGLQQNQSYIANDTSSQPVELQLAFADPLPQEVQWFLHALRNNARISENTLNRVAQHMKTHTSRELTFRRSGNTSSKQRRCARHGNRYRFCKDIYKSIWLGNKIVIFKYENLGDSKSSAERLRPFTVMPDSILEYDEEGLIAEINDKTHYYLDAKIYERRRINNYHATIDTAEFVFRFIPGYAGAERAFVTGETPGDRLLGVAQMVGDAATLGLGSKIRVVQKSAAAIVITSATVRVSSAAYKASQGQAGLEDGVDALIATVESGLAAVTLVKIRLSGLKAVVQNADEAAILGRHLGRSADDVLNNGVTREELKRILGDIPELRHLADDAAGTADDVIGAADDLTPGGQQADDLLPGGQQIDDALEVGADAAATMRQRIASCVGGATHGATTAFNDGGNFVNFGLTNNSDETCEVLARYASNLAENGFEYGWVQRELYRKLRAEAGPEAQKKFLSALKKGMAEGRQSSSGVIKLDLNRPHPSLPAGYTHELKITNSAARLIGYVQDVEVKGLMRTVLVFDRYLPNGLH